MGRSIMHKTARIIKKTFVFAIHLIKKEMPTASAVHRRGANTSKIGSFNELQLKVRRAAIGISHSKEKFAKSAFEEKPRKININK